MTALSPSRDRCAWWLFVTSVLDRLVGADISEERALRHLKMGAVSVDSDPTTDPRTPAPAPSRVVLRL
jgi:hypothetical protein